MKFFKYVITIFSILSFNAYSNNNDIEQYSKAKSIDLELSNIYESSDLELDKKKSIIIDLESSLNLYTNDTYFNIEEDKLLTVIMQNMPKCNPGFDPKLTNMKWSCEVDYGEPLAILSHAYKKVNLISNSNPSYINGTGITFNILKGYDETDVIASLYSYYVRSINVEDSKIKVIPYKKDANFTVKAFLVPK